jgi:tRNA pseudouridine13 synthase
MKLKQQPEDFVVEEVSDFTPSPAGKLNVYRLRKRGLSTLEVVAIIARRYSMRHGAIQVCGLKDKHAVSEQLISMPRQLPADSNDPRWSCEWLGKSEEPVGARNLTSNRFIITIRDLTADESAAVPRTLDAVRHGLVNYFDSQRFGSARHRKGFVARHLIAGEWEDAARLFLTVTARKDRSDVKRRKRLIDAHWGDWKLLDKRIGRSDEKPVVRYLARNPDDFRGALLKINGQLRALLLFAFQSYIWNEAVKRFLRGRDDLTRHVADYAMGELIFADLDGPAGEPLRTMPVPLPTAESEYGDPALRAAVEGVLADEFGLTLAQVAVPGEPVIFFKPVARQFAVLPMRAEWEELGADELNEGKLAGRLTLELPPGCFATLFVKRVFQSQPWPPADA